MNIDEAIDSIQKFNQQITDNPELAANEELRVAVTEVGEIGEMLQYAKENDIPLSAETQEKLNHMDYMLNTILSLV